MNIKNQLILSNVIDIDTDILFILGATCTYKSYIAENIQCNKVIINADSQQVYRSLPELRATPIISNNQIYKLYSYINDEENYNVAQWFIDTIHEIKNAWKNKKLPIIVGGTPFYIYTLLKGVSRAPSFSIDLTNYSTESLIKLVGKTLDRYRLERAASLILSTGKTIEEWNKVPKKLFNLGKCKVYYTKFPLEKDITIRTLSMINQTVHQKLPVCKMPPIGFQEIKMLQQNLISFDEALRKIVIKTRQYAKRQITFFKKIFREFAINKPV